MPESVATILRGEMECEGLLECFHGLNSLEKRCFETLTASSKPLTIDEIADRVERERSTVYRAIQRLHDAGFLRKEQVNYEQGGYYHVYQPADPSDIATSMQRLLNDWYAEMGQLIREFEEKYDDRITIEDGEMISGSSN